MSDMGSAQCFTFSVREFVRLAVTVLRLVEALKHVLHEYAQVAPRLSPGQTNRQRDTQTFSTIPVGTRVPHIDEFAFSASWYLCAATCA